MTYNDVRFRGISYSYNSETRQWREALSESLVTDRLLRDALFEINALMLERDRAFVAGACEQRKQDRSILGAVVSHLSDQNWPLANVSDWKAGN